MIRFFSLQDVNQIYKLGEQLTPLFDKKNNLEEIYNDAYTKILVYEKEGKIIGFLMYIELQDSIDICDIVVDSSYRRQNLASCLLDFLITDLSSTIQLITLEVRMSNIPAIELYKKFNFTIFTIRKNYYENEDAYLMGRKI